MYGRRGSCEVRFALYGGPRASPTTGSASDSRAGWPQIRTTWCTREKDKRFEIYVPRLASVSLLNVTWLNRELTDVFLLTHQGPN